MTDPTTIATGLAMGGGVLALIFTAVLVLKRFLHVCEPNEVLIFSGRKHTSGDGREVGYRVVFGGRTFRIPVFERVDRMDLSLMTVPITMREAYSDGGIPLTVQAIANVKVSSDPSVIGNAIERFLGHDKGEIGRVAKETLEGHLRGVIATMTPEEVNEDRLKFAERLAEEAGSDLRKLGLQLDLLKIQAVSDEVNYLDSIGRKRLAEILREAQVAESDAVRASEKSEASSTARGGVAQAKAHAEVQRKLNELRLIKADLWAQVQSEEQRAEQAAHAARAQAEKALQTLRAEVERLRLMADVTIPADADRQAQTLRAAGEKASIAEHGEAVAEGLSTISAAWKECGDEAMDMVVVQHLDAIVQQVTHAASKVHAKKVKLLDAGDGSTVASYVGAYPKTVDTLLKQLEATFGVDVRGVLRGDRTRRDTTPPSPIEGIEEIEAA